MPVRNYENIDTTSDVTTTTTLLHEAIPLTGTIVSGTYGNFRSERNIKNYTHGMFQSVYDYPYLSSSANHIFDITLGYDETSTLSGSSNRVMNTKKVNMYNQFAQILLGYTSSTGDGIRKFESDLTLDGQGYLKNAFFLTFSRLLTKDQIKKGTFSVVLGTGSWDTPFGLPGSAKGTLTLGDASASVTGFGTTNTDGGDYGVLYDINKKDGKGHGLIFYQSGIAIISSSVWKDADSRLTVFNKDPTYGNMTTTASLSASTISSSCSAFRHRLYNLSYNNTTEINSKIYFCRVPHNKFNYRANPTYVSGSKIVVKNQASDNPVSYITTVGLYNAANELLATAKLSEPLKKDISNDITIRVRLDY